MIEALRKVGPFRTQDPEVSRVIHTLEDYVGTFAASVRANAIQRWAFGGLLLTNASVHKPQPGDALLIDASDGDVVLHVPQATAANLGREIFWLRVAGGNRVIVKVPGGLVNGAASGIFYSPAERLVSYGAKGWRSTAPSTQTADVRTTGAGATDLLTFAQPDDTLAIFTAFVKGVEDEAAPKTYTAKEWSFAYERRNAGNCVEVNTPAKVLVDISDGASWGGITNTLSTTTVKVQVNGKAATDIDWAGILEMRVESL